MAGIEECSNSEFGVGPCGPLMTAKPNRYRYNERPNETENIIDLQLVDENPHCYAFGTLGTNQTI